LIPKLPARQASLPIALIDTNVTYQLGHALNPRPADNNPATE